MTLKHQFLKTKPGDVGIIGDPVEHSLSPLIHNAAFQTWRTAFRDREEPTPAYHRFHVRPEELAEALHLLKEHRLRGMNVTVPHKVAACRLMDVIDSFSKRVGAINTISFSGTKMSGSNTDADGFKRALTRDLEFEMEGKTAVVLGAGGAGRVITLALLDMLAARVYVWNRNPQKLAEISNLSEDAALRVVPVETPIELTKAVRESELIVNATSVGLDAKDGLPVAGLKFKPQHLVFDVVYHRETAFMAEAKKAGATVSGGLGMLLYQGARSFEIWTAAPAPVEIMRSVLSQHFQGV